MTGHALEEEESSFLVKDCIRAPTGVTGHILLDVSNNIILSNQQLQNRQVKNGESEAEFKEFELRLKYGWFHLKLCRRSVETGFGGF